MAPAKREPDEFASFAGDRIFGMASRSGPCIVGVHRPPLVYTGALYGVGQANTARADPANSRSTEKTIIPPGWERSGGGRGSGGWPRSRANSDEVAIIAVPSDQSIAFDLGPRCVSGLRSRESVGNNYTRLIRTIVYRRRKAGEKVPRYPSKSRDVAHNKHTAGLSIHTYTML